MHRILTGWVGEKTVTAKQRLSKIDVTGKSIGALQEPVHDLAALVDTALEMTSKYSFMIYKLRFFGHFRLVSPTFAKES